MSTETNAKPEPSLDESVETLLSEMSQTVDRLETQLGPSAADGSATPAGEVAAAEAPLQDLAAAVDEMVREVAAAVEGAGPTDGAPTAAAKAAESLAKATELVPAEAVDAEVAEAEASLSAPKADAEAASGNEADVEPSLTAVEAEAEPSVGAAAEPGIEAKADEGASDAFASLSDELLAGLDEVAAPEISVTAAAKAAVPAKDDAFTSLTDELLNGLGDVPAPPEPEAVVTPEVAPAASPAPAAASAPEAAEEPPHTTTTARRVLHAAGHAGLSAAHKLEPHALRAAAVISAPLNAKAPALRDTIGWLGVYTLFVGLTLAVYVRFIHETPSPTPAHPGVKLAEKNDHKGAGGEVVRTEAHGGEHGGEHGASADAGGHGAAKEEGHGAKKDDGHGAKKDDGHGGGAKAGGKPLTAPKLPTPAIMPGPEKPGAKKDAKKKDAGHGGGH